MRILHLRDCLRPATQKADETVDLHNQRLSAQTVRNHLKEVNLHDLCPHQGLDRTLVRDRNRLQWANVSHWMTTGTLENRALCGLINVYGVVLASGWLMSMVRTDCPMVVVGL
jgi:hypothetical protein